MGKPDVETQFFFFKGRCFTLGKKDTKTVTSSRDGIPAGEKLKTRKPSFEGA